MQKKHLKILWSFTAIFALLLIGFTINLSLKANAQSEGSAQNLNAYLDSDRPLIIILVEPEYRSLVASVQERGTPIIVSEYLRRSGEDWYQITFNEVEGGWVQGKYISIEKP
ncbi:MAG: hypothetical protein HN392_13860 [Anaerolineae bacterium]|jgi:hypothetical protein|nr:hypothetical protein [Anaerolineae bacterium]MBT7073499.1 hypothetical protein [Anaerolineae bacterium]MBT7783685.1 hypothetical protein [Anaerolineae bacterium]